MSYTNVKVARDEKNWGVDVSAEIPAESLALYRDKALAEIQKTAKLDGFRPGKVPPERIIEIYGEDAVLRRAAEMAVQSELPELLASENLLVVEAPRVEIDALAANKPLTFHAKAPLAPRVEMPDYNAIAQKHQETEENTEVTDEEYAEALTHIRRERARIEKIETGSEPQQASEESKAVEEKDLPPIDAAFVQTLGYPDEAAFGEALRANIKNEKELRAQQKRRGGILDELVSKADIKYPAILLDYELDDIEARFSEDLSRAGVSFEKYLEDVKKTREEMRNEWRAAAESRVKVRLILAEIARREHIEPAHEVIEHELTHARERFSQADPQSLYAGIVHALRNEMTLRFLEGNKEPVGHAGHDH